MLRKAAQPLLRSPRAAFAVAALTGLVWLNQGPSSRRYDALTSTPPSERAFALRAWLPFAFAYRRSIDEELYYATASAIRGAPCDRAMLAARRGLVPEGFRHLPPADGHWHVPYAEVPFEYPALVLPFILAPALLSPTFDVFAVLSGALMGALLLASIAVALRARRSTDAERAEGWWLGAAMLLAQGGIAIQRLDAIPAAALALALWAAARRRPFTMGIGIGLAAAAKVTPLLALFPMMAADRDAWRSPRALVRAASGVGLSLAAGFVPILVASPGALAEFAQYHRARGLHIESTYGTLAAVAALLGGHVRSATMSFGSYNLDGDAARMWATAATPILVASIALLSWWVALRPAASTKDARAEAIACAGLGALLCVWLFGKVFSPQYMTWAIPFALTIQARRVAFALIAAMAITQLYLCGFYDHVVDMRVDGVLALVARLAALATLAAYVLCPLSRGEREPAVVASLP